MPWLRKVVVGTSSKAKQREFHHLQFSHQCLLPLPDFHSSHYGMTVDFLRGPHYQCPSGPLPNLQGYTSACCWRDQANLRDLGCRTGLMDQWIWSDCGLNSRCSADSACQARLKIGAKMWACCGEGPNGSVQGFHTKLPAVSPWCCWSSSRVAKVFSVMKYQETSGFYSYSAAKSLNLASWRRHSWAPPELNSCSNQGVAGVDSMLLYLKAMCQVHGWIGPSHSDCNPPAFHQHDRIVQVLDLLVFEANAMSRWMNRPFPSNAEDRNLHMPTRSKEKKPSSTIWSKIHFCSGPWHKNHKLTFAADTWPIRGFTRFNLGPNAVEFQLNKVVKELLRVMLCWVHCDA